MGSPLFMKYLSKILLPLLIMLWLNGCMSVKTQIVGQTYQPLEPQEVHVFTLKEFIEIILEKRKCEQLAYIKIKNIPRKKIPWTSPAMKRQKLVQIILLLLPFITTTWEGIISK